MLKKLKQTSSLVIAIFLSFFINTKIMAATYPSGCNTCATPGSWCVELNNYGCDGSYYNAYTDPRSGIYYPGGYRDKNIHCGRLLDPYNNFTYCPDDSCTYSGPNTSCPNNQTCKMYEGIGNSCANNCIEILGGITPTLIPTITTTPTLVPTITPNPTSPPTITPTNTTAPTPTETPYNSSCDYLESDPNEIRINNSITFKTHATDTGGEIQAMKYYFGDGFVKTITNIEKNNDNYTSEVDHKYEISGTYYPRVKVKDSHGIWKTSNSCKTEVSVKPSSVESHKSDCDYLYVTADNSAYAPSEITFEITGYDNKGEIQGYKIIVNGETYKKYKNDHNPNIFKVDFDTAGTYTAKAYIKDSKDNWKGGDDYCKRSVYIKTKRFITQPKTGTPTIFTISGIGSGINLAWQLLKKKKQVLL